MFVCFLEEVIEGLWFGDRFIVDLAEERRRSDCKACSYLSSLGVGLVDWRRRERREVLFADAPLRVGFLRSGTESGETFGSSRLGMLALGRGGMKSHLWF